MHAAFGLPAATSVACTPQSRRYKSISKFELRIAHTDSAASRVLSVWSGPEQLRRTRAELDDVEVARLRQRHQEHLAHASSVSRLVDRNGFGCFLLATNAWQPRFECLL
jgi:hypothetical protein